MSRVLVLLWLLSMRFDTMLGSSRLGRSVLGYWL